MEAWLRSLVHNGDALKSHINRFVPTTKTYGRDSKTKGTCPLQGRPISFVNFPGLIRCFADSAARIAFRISVFRTDDSTDLIQQLSCVRPHSSCVITMLFPL
jgi:hypothetical protein